jgi:hypothetical protein
MRKLFLLLTVVFLSGHYSKASAPTDYFRSTMSGDWATLSTWESSPDNATWSAATLIPTSTANTITIQGGHTVAISSNQDMDQVVVDLAATLQHNGGTLTVNDGPGDDITVVIAGVFHININPGPVFSGAATMRINFSGTLRLSASGQTGAGTGVNASNYVYDHNSVLEYTLPLAFSTAGVTYFPNAAPGIAPIFRTTNNIGLVGATTTTTFNGLFEANGNITFANSGEKIFRNGISGTGNIDGSASGKFIINGTGATLGGTGNLTVPAVDGMEIGNGTLCGVILTASKTITNNITLLNNTYLYLLVSHNLTMNGIITGGSGSSHVVTTGTGKLIINNIGVTPVTFPVGRMQNLYNPITLSNGGGLNYGVRVDTGISPAIAVPVKAVNRTWYVTPSGGTPGTVNTNFFYAAGHGNAGFNYAANLELGQHTGVWNVIQTGLVPAGSYQVATTVSTFANNTEAPLVLGNLYAILAADEGVSVNYFTGIKQSGSHFLKWKLTCNSTPAVTMILERSADGISYTGLFSEYATALRCQQPFNYNDAQPAKGVNYYRIKITDVDGKITYSTVVTLINAIKGIEVMDITPNPIVNGAFNLKISTAEKIQMELVITDMQGRILQKQSVPMVAGFNSIAINVRNLAAGTYQLFGNTADGRTRVLRFVMQQ